MKTVAISTLQRRLPELIRSREPIEVTRHGESIGILSVRYTVKPKSRLTMAQAAQRAREMLACAPIARPGEGITDELRRLRDRGESLR